MNQVKKFEMLGPACTVPALPADEKEALEAAGAAAEEVRGRGEEFLPSGGGDDAEEETQNLEDSQLKDETINLACGPKAVKNGSDGEVGQGPTEPSSSEHRRYNLRPKTRTWRDLANY
uniref:Uncharacterized protein n=1 Tax=Globodera rostochiensis TaxID=31243 RepID=A0A914HJM1_GLORO